MMREASVQSAGTRPMGRRVAFVHPVLVRPVGDGAAVERVFATDVSRGGMFLRTPRIRPEGTRLQLEVEIDGAVVPLGIAEVVWARSIHAAERDGRLAGFAVRFVELTRRARGLIKRTVATEEDAFAATVRRPVEREAAFAARPEGSVPLAWWVVPAGLALAVLFTHHGVTMLNADPLGLRHFEERWPSKAAVQKVLSETPVDAGAVGPTGHARLASAEARGDAVEAPPVAPLPASEAKDVAAEAPGVAPVSSIEFDTAAARQLRVLADARVLRAFSMRNPSRLVFDVEGVFPAGLKRFEGSSAVRGIEVIPSEARTRLRLELSAPVDRIQLNERDVVVYLRQEPS